MGEAVPPERLIVKVPPFVAVVVSSDRYHSVVESPAGSALTVSA